MKKYIDEFYSNVITNQADRTVLIDYLKREKEKVKDKRFNVVMDLLYDCNLSCVGCGTDANGMASEMGQLTVDLASVETACRKIKDYAQKKKLPVFINLGGGEPFLHKDIEQIVDIIYLYFGEKSIGIDTNATVPNEVEIIKRVLPKISYLGISINGMKDYHNWYCGRDGFDAYSRACEVVKKLCLDKFNREKIEITSVATKKNIKTLPQVFEIMASYGVCNYSVHRAIPVGRMAENMELVPSAEEYLRLLIELIKVSDKYKKNCHIHHSIENIHKSILLGGNTFCDNKYGDRNDAASIGISPRGDVVFDAWSVSGIWNKISCGNIFRDNKSLEEMLSDEHTVFSQFCSMTEQNSRCEGCVYPCSGGNRIVAAATRLTTMKSESIGIEQLKELFTAIDPACPRYSDS